MHLDIVLCESSHLVALFLGFPEYNKLTTCLVGVEGLGFLFGYLVQYFAAALAFCFRYDAYVQLQHAGVSSLGVCEYVQLAHVQSFDKLYIVVEVLLCLASDAYHTIYADEGMWHDLFDVLNTLFE